MRVNTDTGGMKVGEQAHLPFGDLWYSFDSTSKWRFTTYEHDPESDNDYAINRSYVSRLGRFSVPDRYVGSISDPQSLNQYVYVRNDPVSLADPLGLWPVCRTYLVHYVQYDQDTGEVISDTVVDEIKVCWGASDSRGHSRSEPKDEEKDENAVKQANQCAADLANTFTINPWQGEHNTAADIFLNNEISAWSNLIFGNATPTGRTDAAASLAVTNSIRGASATSLVAEGAAQAPTGAYYVNYGTQISNDLLRPAEETASFTAQKVGGTWVGRVGRALSSIMSGKLVFDTGVYLGALWVCSQQVRGGR